MVFKSPDGGSVKVHTLITPPFNTPITYLESIMSLYTFYVVDDHIKTKMVVVLRNYLTGHIVEYYVQLFFKAWIFLKIIAQFGSF